MIRTVFVLSTAAFFVLGSRPVRAEGLDHPRLFNKRDVTVVYEVQPDALPRPVMVTVFFKADGNKVRIDYPNKLGSTILDRFAQCVTIMMNKQRLYTTFSPQHGLRSPFLIDLTMKFRRRGVSQVASLACQEWEIESSHGKAKACITEDGVILAEQGVDADGLKGELKAQSVVYGLLADTLFQPPAGYERISPKIHLLRQPHVAKPLHP